MTRQQLQSSFHGSSRATSSWKSLDVPTVLQRLERRCTLTLGMVSACVGFKGDRDDDRAREAAES